MAYIPCKPMKIFTKQEMIKKAKQVHEETVKFLKMLDENERLSKIQQKKHPIYFAVAHNI